MGLKSRNDCAGKVHTREKETAVAEGLLFYIDIRNCLAGNLEPIIEIVGYMIER